VIHWKSFEYMLKIYANYRMVLIKKIQVLTRKM